jgi:hypothetical protein
VLVIYLWLNVAKCTFASPMHITDVPFRLGSVILDNEILPVVYNIFIRLLDQRWVFYSTGIIIYPRNVSWYEPLRIANCQLRIFLLRVYEPSQKMWHIKPQIKLSTPALVCACCRCSKQLLACTQRFIGCISTRANNVLVKEEGHTKLAVFVDGAWVWQLHLLNIVRLLQSLVMMMNRMQWSRFCR